MFVDGRGEAFNTTRTEPTGDTDDIIDYLPKVTHLLRGPARFHLLAKIGHVDKSKRHSALARTMSRMAPEMWPPIGIPFACPRKRFPIRSARISSSHPMQVFSLLAKNTVRSHSISSIRPPIEVIALVRCITLTMRSLDLAILETLENNSFFPRNN